MLDSFAMEVAHENRKLAILACRPVEPGRVKRATATPLYFDFNQVVPRRRDAELRCRSLNGGLITRTVSGGDIAECGFLRPVVQYVLRRSV